MPNLRVLGSNGHFRAKMSIFGMSSKMFQNVYFWNVFHFCLPKLCQLSQILFCHGLTWTCVQLHFALSLLVLPRGTGFLRHRPHRLTAPSYQQPLLSTGQPPFCLHFGVPPLGLFPCRWRVLSYTSLMVSYFSRSLWYLFFRKSSLAVSLKFLHQH